ncbi:MAG TPA: hypothetical protein VJR89_21445 [Polyangiales bacterium]|nr:hypothetical protein [Polyangiales bacterium]
MNRDPLALSERGDLVFARLAAHFETARTWRLLIEQQLERERFAAVRSAMLAYLARVMDVPGVLSEERAMELLLQRRDSLPNYTRGGMLAPTREHTLEFNALHRSLVAALREYALDDAIDGIDLPINVRLVYGDADEARQRAPFSSTKLHSDVWAGVPPDAAVVVLPVLGDIDNITIECFEMERDLEFGAMRAMRDYDEGKHIRPIASYTDCRMRHGHLYVADARLLHQTVRKKREGVRLSIDFRFRYNDPEYRALMPQIERGGPDSYDSRVPFATWSAIGDTSLIVFEDTMDDLRARKGGAASSSPVNAARYRILPLAGEEVTR